MLQGLPIFFAGLLKITTVENLVLLYPVASNKNQPFSVLRKKLLGRSFTGLLTCPSRQA
jgi:hypothetical protein